MMKKKTDGEDNTITELCYITDFVSSQRLRWMGHVACTEELRLPRNVMEWTMPGRRPAGRTQLKWKDGVMKGLESAGILNPLEEYEDLTANRRMWRSLVQIVMGLHEAWGPSEKKEVHLFASSKRDLRSLPQTEHTFRHYVLWIPCQINLYKQAFPSNLTLPSPEDFGST